MARPRAATARAHPRSRGENPNFVKAMVDLGGSSPLTRGKPNFPWDQYMGLGLIPAHAGKTNLAT